MVSHDRCTTQNCLTSYKKAYQRRQRQPAPVNANHNFAPVTLLFENHPFCFFVPVEIDLIILNLLTCRPLPPKTLPSFCTFVVRGIKIHFIWRSIVGTLVIWSSIYREVRIRVFFRHLAQWQYYEKTGLMGVCACKCARMRTVSWMFCKLMS